MAIFAITFRIHEDADRSKRYQSLVYAIQKEASGFVWDEPTSFALIENTKNSSDLCDALYYGSEILESKDLLLVVNLSQKGYAQRGSKYPNMLESLMAER